MIKEYQIIKGSLLRYPPKQAEDLIADSIIGPVKGFDRYGFLKFNDLGSEEEKNLKNCIGVPLTEDYLHAFELEKLKNDNDEFKLAPMFYLKKQGSRWLLYMVGNFEIIELMEFEYVHELQLFYAGLTKRELKYDPHRNQKPF